MRTGICFIILALFIEIVCVANGAPHAVWMVSALLTLIGLTIIGRREDELTRIILKHENEIKELKNKNE